MASSSKSSFDQQRWVIQIRRTLEEELEDDAGVPVCIFNVPRTLLSSKPDCYVPQEVAIGPYHYWRLELYEMERFKLAAAKRIQKQLQGLKLENLVDQLMKHDPRIRACFHKYLDFNTETLAWMVAVDACFLLECLKTYAIKDGKVQTSIQPTMSNLVDHAGIRRSSAHNALLRDIIMLENQIPLFILRKILEFQYSSLDEADDLLHSMLMGLCEELSPLKMIENSSNIQVTDCAHLLDSLYQTIVPKSYQSDIVEASEDQKAPSNDDEEEKVEDSSYLKKLLKVTWKLLSKLKAGPVRFINTMLLPGLVRIVIRLPWAIITRLPGFSIFAQPVHDIFFSEAEEDIKYEHGNSNSNDHNKPPLLEEISIPSVSELHKAGMRFVATKGDITTVSFDAKTFTLRLPSVSLDVNTEVVFRNLVAYEAADATRPLVFTRYIELMNGILDTEEDVKLLREKGIVLNRLKTDQEVAELWNGMSKSVRLTKVPFLDMVIEDVNKYYSGRWKVKAKKFLKSYVFGSWQFLTLLAAILFLLLMTLQAFCSVFGCVGILRINTTIG